MEQTADARTSSDPPAAASIRLPSTSPRFADRVSALRSRAGALSWLYALVPVPLFTDWIENGAPPHSPRGWLTEVLGGFVIALLVGRVRRDQRALESMARTDGLTGLLNRRAFQAAIEVECARAERTGDALCVAYFDLDRFKDINDRFGHAAGDQVLLQFAVALRASIRERVDTVYRIGGDEFAMILPSSQITAAAVVVTRIRTRCDLNDSRWAVGPFDVSVGIVAREPDDSAEALLARGDAEMYRQKAVHRKRSR